MDGADFCTFGAEAAFTVGFFAVAGAESFAVVLTRSLPADLAAAAFEPS